MLSICPVICLFFLESLTQLPFVFVVVSVPWGSDGAIPGQEELGLHSRPMQAAGSVLFLGVGPAIQPTLDHLSSSRCVLGLASWFFGFCWGCSHGCSQLLD